MLFKSGDRVETKFLDTHTQKYINFPGTILYALEDKNIVAVEFDEFIGGHDCYTFFYKYEKKGKDGYCWFCDEETLLLLNRQLEFKF